MSFIVTCAYIFEIRKLDYVNTKEVEKQGQFEKGSDINHVEKKAAIHKLIAQKVYVYSYHSRFSIKLRLDVVIAVS